MPTFTTGHKIFNGIRESTSPIVLTAAVELINSSLTLRDKLLGEFVKETNADIVRSTIDTGHNNQADKIAIRPEFLADAEALVGTLAHEATHAYLDASSDALDAEINTVDSAGVAELRDRFVRYSILSEVAGVLMNEKIRKEIELVHPGTLIDLGDSRTDRTVLEALERARRETTTIQGLIEHLYWELATRSTPKYLDYYQGLFERLLRDRPSGNSPQAPVRLKTAPQPFAEKSSSVGDALQDLFRTAEHAFAMHRAAWRELDTPLILDLDGDGVETTDVSAGVYFDHDNNGLAERTAWVDADDGLLVWDRNGNGNIDNGTELFGNHTPLTGGSNAANGFQALAALDDNADGKIDAQDASWNNLRVWRDTNLDAEVSAGELLSKVKERGQDRICTQAELTKLKEELAKQEHRNQLLELKAPQAGIVKDVATHTTGAVVSHGTILMTLVPVNEPLQAEVLIKNEDVGFVKEGQSVKIKLAAYPFQKYGMLEGKITHIGPDAAETQAGAGQMNSRGQDATASATSPYQATIELESQNLTAQGEQFELTPGMQVVAEINQGKRTIMEYLLSPVRGTLQEAAREK